MHNNPINLIDPTGMEADGWRKDRQSGEISYDQSYTHENTDDSRYEYGDAFYENGIAYNSDGTTSVGESSGESVPCVECHHTTGQGMGLAAKAPMRNPRNILDLKEGGNLWGEGSLSANNLMAENKRGKILFSLDLGNVSSRSSANVNEGMKGFYEYLSGLSSRESDYKTAGGGLLKGDPKVLLKYKTYDIYTFYLTGDKGYILPNHKDTVVRQSQIKNVRAAEQYDSLRLVPLLK